ncbi:MAG: sulfatase family protein [Limisphaerales bacterium]
MKRFLLIIIAVGQMVALGADGEQRPNILFVLTDDQRFDSLRCMGNALIRTPHIDRLATNGVIFRNHFVTTPICSVSRASIFTGQYLRRHRIGDFATPLSKEQWVSSYPALLRAAGYRTGFIGKFGVGNAKSIAERKSDFDYWRGLPGQAGEWFIDPKDPKGQHATARFGDEALEFIEGCSNATPFCLSISFNAPHARDGKPREFRPDGRDEELYVDEVIPVPATATENHFRALPEFVQKSEARRRWEKRFATEEMFQRTMRDYYRLVTGIDREVGRILERLAARGFDKNTVVIFTSDNGWFAGERGLADKWFIYEESIRVPLIIFDPRRSAAERGRVVEAMTLNLDFAPTMLSMAGVKVPEGMQGRSLEPLLAGQDVRDWRKAFYFEHHFRPDIIPPSEGVRTEERAYVRWLAPNPELEEMYDLRRDPRQESNVVSDASAAVVLEELREETRRLRAQAQ